MGKTDWNAITIADDFMFGTVFSNPEMCRPLLERLLSMPIERVVMVQRERAMVPELSARGIRMDVYAADEEGHVYNVEMQKVNKHDLLKRSRYYLSANDVDCITPGEDFRELRDSFVIFVCLFDPIGDGLARYTVTPHCRETGQELADGAARVFVNALAYDACDEPRLAAFLRYLSRGTIGGDGFCEAVDAEVRRNRNLPEWRLMHMRFDVYLRDRVLEAEERGEKRGLERGLERGKKRERRRLVALYTALCAAGREGEFATAVADDELRARLYEEFGIGLEDPEDDESSDVSQSAKDHEGPMRSERPETFANGWRSL